MHRFFADERGVVQGAAYLNAEDAGHALRVLRLESGDEVELDYDLGAQPFHRIRRITGYLVGTLDRFNNAKRAEEHDRVKHTVG